jgi:hypothetical protein
LCFDKGGRFNIEDREAKRLETPGIVVEELSRSGKEFSSLESFFCFFLSGKRIFGQHFHLKTVKYFHQ